MNGAMVDWKDATIHVASHVIHYGTGAFEGLRAYDSKTGTHVFRLEPHMRRMMDSCRIYRTELRYTVDDLVAVGALRAVKEHRRAVPQQVAVIGFNDSPFCNYVEPPLSSVAVDIRALAQIATDLLIRLIEEREVHQRRYIVPCQLVERSST